MENCKEEYTKGYNDAMELVNYIVTYDISAAEFRRRNEEPVLIPMNFFKKSGLSLIHLYKIDKRYPKHIKSFFTDIEYKEFIKFLRDNNDFDGRYMYENFDVNTTKFFSSYSTFIPEQLIKEGWLPELDSFNGPQSQVFLVGMNRKIPEDTWKYFYDDETPDEFLKKRKIWRRADTQMNSVNRRFVMMFYHPEMLWSSNRPKTDMKMFQQENYLLGDIKSNILVVEDKRYRIYGRSSENENLDGVAFPVSRYAEDTDTGLYYQTKGNFCGTFYYIEPESIVYLISNKVIFSRTKTSSAQLIAKPQTKFALWEAERRNSYERNYNNQKLYDEGKLRPGLLYTPIQAHEELGFRSYRDPYSVTQYPIYMGSRDMKQYDFYEKGLYGVEDEYDQPLCIEMKQQGIEIACLTEMIGAFGIVSELLDARERKKSFDNLVYTT
jgi:hypothetical protein